MELNLLVGVPGSGKSTLASKWLETGTVEGVVCPDEIRRELTGSAADQSRNREVWILTYERVRERLALGERVVIDATSLRPDYRAPVLAIGTEYGVSPIAHLVVAPLWLCRRRNRHRAMPVPDDVMEQMERDFRDFCTPSVMRSEGFAVVVYRRAVVNFTLLRRRRR